MEQAVLIIGGGMAGLACAWRLAQRGVDDVLVLDRTAPFSESSAKNAAISMTLSADPIVDALARRSASGWDELTLESGLELVDRSGLVLAAPSGSDLLLEPVFENATRSATSEEEPVPGRVPATPPAHLGKVKRLGREELASRLPFLSTVPAMALFRASDGIVHLQRLQEALTEALLSRGGRIRDDARVEELLIQGSRITGARLATGEELRAKKTVLAAGAWASMLGEQAGSVVRLTATRRHLAVTVPCPEVDPTWPVFWMLGENEFYCRPVPEEQGLMLCACDETPIEDPDLALSDATVLKAIRSRAAEHLSIALPKNHARFWCGLRTFAHDRRFVVGPDPDLKDLVWVAGLGGAGISTGLEVGRIAALSVLDADVSDPVAEALDPRRLVDSMASD